MEITPRRAKLLAQTIKDKLSYYQSQKRNFDNELISKGTPIVRINAAMARERVRAYEELLLIINK